MRIDFQIRPITGDVRGLNMELVPSTLEGDAIAEDKGIYIGEDAFGFLEPSITQCWPRYADYGHWGLSKIPMAVWRDIHAAWINLNAQLSAAASPEDVFGIGFLSDDVRYEFSASFESMKMQMAEMIASLLNWLARRFDRYECITIKGI